MGGGRWGEGVLGADVGDAEVSRGDGGRGWPTGTAARHGGRVAPLPQRTARVSAQWGCRDGTSPSLRDSACRTGLLRRRLLLVGMRLEHGGGSRSSFFLISFVCMYRTRQARASSQSPMLPLQCTAACMLVRDSA